MGGKQSTFNIFSGGSMFTRFATRGCVGLLVLMLVLVGFSTSRTVANTTQTKMEIVSRAFNGDTKKGGGVYPVVSANGQYVAFVSGSPDLVENDTNEKVDVFVYARQTSEMTRVSVATGGGQSNGYSGNYVSISGDGQLIAFESEATNLDPDDKNNRKDIFVHDLKTHTTKRVSVASDGSEGDYHSSQVQISENGRYVVFVSGTAFDGANNGDDVFLHDLSTGETRWVSKSYDGTGSVLSALHPSVSNDGVVAFYSDLLKLVPNDTNGREDIFVRDMNTGKIDLISRGYDGSPANWISNTPTITADGRFVTYTSAASNLFEEDTNQVVHDVFQYDRQLGVTILVSVDDNENQGKNPSFAGYSSSDGRFVTFVSGSKLAANAPNNTNHVYIRDIWNGTTDLVSATQDGIAGNGGAMLWTSGSMSSDGNVITFYSGSTNLVSPDDNQSGDVFVYDRSPDVVPTPTPTSNPNAKQVVVFIPGIAGSQLARGDSVVPGSYAWPAYFELNQNDMTLKPGSRRDDIYTDDVIRKYDPLNIPRYREQIYGPFLDRLAGSGYVEYETGRDPTKRRPSGCDISQTSANLFVFPWDWRFGAVDAVDRDGNKDLGLSLAPNNTQLLKEYIQCIWQIHPNAEITLVTHSMGWFIGRTYVLENPTDHHITRHIAIAPPRLGAPDTIAMMLTGDWLPELISKDLTRTLLEHFPGAHQLLPSQLYWKFAGSPFALNNPLTKRGDVEFSEFQQVLQDYYISPGEGDFYRSSVPFVNNMQKVYQNPSFANLRDDNSGVEYRIIYGIKTDEDGKDIATTVSKVIERPIWRYDGVLELDKEYDYGWTIGDETVPEVSATAIGNGDNLNGNTIPHMLKGSGMEHQDMMNEPRLQDCVLALLQGDTCISDLPTAASNTLTPARYIKLWGVDEIYVTDGISTTQNLITTTLTLGMFPDISAKYLGDHSIMFIVTGDKQYTVDFTGQGEYFESESQYGTGDTNLRVMRFSPEPAPGQHLALVTTQNSLAEMQVDTNGDGNVDTKVEPLADLQGDVANDTTPPGVTAAYEHTTGLVVTATDTESGVATISYTVDGTHFKTYTEGVIFTDKSITSVTVIAQDKAGNFSKPATVPVTVIASNTIYLPLINR